MRLKARFLGRHRFLHVILELQVSILDPEELGHLCGREWGCVVALLSCLRSLCNAPPVCGFFALYWVSASFLVSWILLQKCSFPHPTPPLFPSLSLSLPTLPFPLPYYTPFPPIPKPLSLSHPPLSCFLGNILFLYIFYHRQHILLNVLNTSDAWYFVK